MAAVKEGDTVRVHYTGTLTDGSVFDSSRDRGPLEFTVGQKQLIPGFEEAVLGMAPGDTKKQALASDEAYGPFQQELVQDLPREEFPEGAELSEGQQFKASMDGSNVILTVVAVAEETVTVDGNHPLAGKDLEFEIELVEIV
jgi:peptidylprolyl isomerase